MLVWVLPKSDGCKKAEKTIYECQSTSFICSASPKRSQEVYETFSLPISRGVRWFLVVRDFIMLQGQECLPALGMMCALVWSMWTRAHGECHGSCPRAGARTAVLEGHPVNEVWLMCWVAPWQPPAVQGASREMHVACSCIRGVPHLPQAREGIAVLKESQLLINIAG